VVKSFTTLLPKRGKTFAFLDKSVVKVLPRFIQKRGKKVLPRFIKSVVKFYHAFVQSVVKLIFATPTFTSSLKGC
jgi:hypothetical protein